MAAPLGLRVHVTCEFCRFRQSLERKATRPGDVDLICHSCEAQLRVTIPADRFAALVLAR